MDSGRRSPDRGFGLALLKVLLVVSLLLLVTWVAWRRSGSLLSSRWQRVYDDGQAAVFAHVVRAC